MAATVLGIYYLFVLLLLFGKDLRRLVTKARHRATLAADQPSPPQGPIMGPAFTEAAPLLSIAADLRVAPDAAQRVDTTPSPAVAALLREVRPLLEVALETRADKAGFLSLLGLVTGRHPLSAAEQETAQDALLALTQGQLPFPLSDSELQALWPDSAPSSTSPAC